MDIVVAGNGKVGTTLTEQLAKEGHNITIIDNDIRVIEHLVTDQDVLGICGSGSSYDTLMDAGVENADLFIAATSGDELNILGCMLARKLGAKRTIARVRNPEYRKVLGFLREELGLSMAINPELVAAEEIFRILRIPEALEVDSFANGRVDIISIKLEKGSKLAGYPLSEMSRIYHAKILICAVERAGQVTIPDGNYVLEVGDNIYITGSSMSLDLYFDETGINKRDIHNVMIIGGGKISYYLAHLLLDLDFNVKIIEIDRERCLALSENLPKAIIINGDGTNQDVLNEEGIDKMDACIALTDNDEENIILSMYAVTLNMIKVVTKVNRISFLKIIGDIGIDSVISPKVLTANQIVRYVRAMETTEDNSIQTLYQIVDGQAEAIEFLISSDYLYSGVKLKNINLKKNNLIASIIRKGKLIIPDGNTEIFEGDHVVVVTTCPLLVDFMDIVESAVQS